LCFGAFPFVQLLHIFKKKVQPNGVTPRRRPHLDSDRRLIANSQNGFALGMFLLHVLVRLSRFG
jgi:hypothetical protein